MPISRPPEIYITRLHSLAQVESNINKHFCNSIKYFKTTTHLPIITTMSDYENQNIPSGDAGDNDYASRTGQYQIPVQKDEAPVEDPIDPNTADSDEQLGKSNDLSFA